MKLNEIYPETNHVPADVQYAARMLFEHFTIRRGHSAWALFNVCSRDSLSLIEVKNASLRGQLKGLHRARRTRERQLEEKIASLEKKIGQLPKFTP